MMSAKVPTVSDTPLLGLSSSEILSIARNCNPFDRSFIHANTERNNSSTLNTPDASGLVPSRPTASISHTLSSDKNDNTEEVKTSEEKADNTAEPPRKSSSNLSLKLPESNPEPEKDVSVSEPEGVRNIMMNIMDSNAQLNPDLSTLINQIQDGTEPPATADLVKTVLDMTCGKSQSPKIAPVNSSINTNVPNTNHGVTLVPVHYAPMSTAKPMQVVFGGRTMNLVPNDTQDIKPMQTSTTTLMPTYNISRPTSNCSSSDGQDSRHNQNNDSNAGDDSDKRREMLERNRAAAVRYRKRKREENDDLKGQMRVLENDKLTLEARVSVLTNELNRLQQLLARSQNRCASCRCDTSDTSFEGMESSGSEVANDRARTSNNTGLNNICGGMRGVQQAVLTMPDGKQALVHFVQPPEEEPSVTLECKPPTTLVKIQDRTILK